MNAALKHNLSLHKATAFKRKFLYRVVSWPILSIYFRLKPLDLLHHMKIVVFSTDVTECVSYANQWESGTLDKAATLEMKSHYNC
jgi:hypothetical protein